MSLSSLDLPKLRPLIFTRRDEYGQAFVTMEDPLGVAAGPMHVTLDAFQLVVRHFDGETSLVTIQDRVLEQTGQTVSTEELQGLVQQFDQGMMLEGPTFDGFLQAYKAQAQRPAAHAGSVYARDPGRLKAQLAHFFKHPEGSGSPRRHEEGRTFRLRAILSPHIDFKRGGPVYTWSYKEIVECCEADIFVILGVAHQYSKNRFALTRKDFETPLGLVRTDREFVDRLVELAGEKYLDDELAHRTEHSVEFQAVFLQYLLGERRPFTIVPILAGSFHDLIESGVDPILDPDVKSFVDAIRRTEAESGKKVAYIGGIDLSHVGQDFGDPDLLDSSTLEQIREFDRAMLDCAVAGDAAGWFQTAALVENRWRVCGLAATYTLLHAIGPAAGRVLKYDQAVNPQLTCCVSFASVAFENPNPTEASPA